MSLRQVFLIRHGETAWSLSGQHTGRTDIALTEHGEQAARQLGTRLQSVPFAHVFTSPLLRARQTCSLAQLAPPAELEPALTEWDYGDDEGKTTQEIQVLRPSWNLFRDGCPNGETPAQVAHRADALIALLRLLDGPIALFSHGHFGRVLAARWIGLPVAQAQHFLLSTASLSTLAYEHDQPVIALWNAEVGSL